MLQYVLYAIVGYVVIQMLRGGGEKKKEYQVELETAPTAEGTRARRSRGQLQRRRRGANTNFLKAGEYLTPGQRLVSNNGAFEAVMQSDANFVVYTTGSDAVPAGYRNRFVWNSGITSPMGDRARLNLQSDGNVCVSDGIRNIWCAMSGTHDTRLIYTLMLRDDGTIWVTGQHPDTYNYVWQFNVTKRRPSFIDNLVDRLNL